MFLVGSFLKSCLAVVVVVERKEKKRLKRSQIFRKTFVDAFHWKVSLFFFFWEGLRKSKKGEED